MFTQTQAVKRLRKLENRIRIVRGGSSAGKTIAILMILIDYAIKENYKEISETMGISEVNARVKMNRVKTKLRTILNP